MSGRSPAGPGRGVTVPRPHIPIWLLPALLTLAVTLTGLDRAPLWRDELATWSAATRGVTGLVRLAGTIDAATGPYYLLMHGWIAAVGDSQATLRLPAALAMAGTAGLTAVLGERLAGPRTGLLGGLLFAVLPGTSRYGQEARPYALAALFAVLSTLLLVAALHRGGPARWTGYAAAVTGLGLTHLVALTLLAAHALAVLAARRGPRSTAWWLLALLPAALVLTPLALVARGQRARQLAWVDPARLADLSALPGGVVQSGAAGGLLVGLAALGAARLGRRGLLPVACVALPVLAVFAAGLVVALWVPRYLVFVLPFACLLAGAALTTVRLPAALAVLLLAGALGLPDQAALRRTHEWPRSAGVDYRGAAAVVAAGAQPGDAVVYEPRDSWLFLDLGLRYHLRGRTPRDALLAEDAARRGDLWAAECDRPADCLAGVDRVWLVLAGRRSDPLAAVPGAKGAALRADYTVVRVQQPDGLTVALLTR
ncbi:mannosyltransferase [Micromonospora nigra]|uniref:Mannosyltransferase n=1 Tax=Micromonospora nigra TaxID=145857 RepID=A0A1C6RPK2_9ACTN|nr:glycosyltransferase family 39 protein [Micromonospora nigra]SCL18972.1 mannosyltransferase [Micromonospora nigra]